MLETMVDVKKSTRSVFSIDSILSANKNYQHDHRTPSVELCSGIDDERQSNQVSTDEDQIDIGRLPDAVSTSKMLQSGSSISPELDPMTARRHGGQESDAAWLRQFIADVARQFAVSSSSMHRDSTSSTLAMTSSTCPIADRSDHIVKEECSGSGRKQTFKTSPSVIDTPDELLSKVDQRSMFQRQSSYSTSFRRSPQSDVAVGGDENGTLDEATASVSSGSCVSWLATVNRSIHSMRSTLAGVHADDNVEETPSITTDRCSTPIQQQQQSRDSIPTFNFIDTSKRRIFELYRDMMEMSHVRRLLPPEVETDDGGAGLQSGLEERNDEDVERSMSAEFGEQLDRDSDMEMDVVERTLDGVRRRPLSAADCLRDLYRKPHPHILSEGSSESDSVWKHVLRQRYGEYFHCVLIRNKN